MGEKPLPLPIIAAALRSFADNTPDGKVRLPADYVRKLADYIDAHAKEGRL